MADFEFALELVRSLPHGHVAALLGTIFKIGLDQIISSEKSRELSLIGTMIRTLPPRAARTCWRRLNVPRPPNGNPGLK